MTDEMKGLREAARQLRAFWAQDSGTSVHLVAADQLDQAATAIETLLAERERLREALQDARRFIWNSRHADSEDDPIETCDSCEIVRRIDAALKDSTS